MRPDRRRGRPPEWPGYRRAGFPIPGRHPSGWAQAVHPAATGSACAAPPAWTSCRGGWRSSPAKFGARRRGGRRWHRWTPGGWRRLSEIRSGVRPGESRGGLLAARGSRRAARRRHAGALRGGLVGQPAAQQEIPPPGTRLPGPGAGWRHRARDRTPPERWRGACRLARRARHRAPPARRRRSLCARGGAPRSRRAPCGKRPPARVAGGDSWMRGPVRGTRSRH